MCFVLANSCFQDGVRQVVRLTGGEAVSRRGLPSLVCPRYPGLRGLSLWNGSQHRVRGYRKRGGRTFWWAMSAACVPFSLVGVLCACSLRRWVFRPSGFLCARWCPPCVSPCSRQFRCASWCPPCVSSSPTPAFKMVSARWFVLQGERQCRGAACPP